MKCKRYEAIEGSQSGHCCFEATVIDTTRPSSIRRDAFVIVCECFDFADAEEIARALNRMVDNPPA